jgi:hypothetical protein
MLTCACRLSLSWTKQIQMMPSNPISIFHFIITLQSTAGSYTWPLSFRFPHQPHVCIYLLSYLCRMLHTCQPPWLDLMVLTVCGEEHKPRSCALYNSLQPPITSLLQGKKYHLWHPILEHHSPNPSLTVKDSVSHPCTTIFNIRVLCFNLYELGYKVGRLKRVWTEL